jgi:CRP-like cAMP-binding protein/CheY-like chemotaxis protein
MTGGNGTNGYKKVLVVDDEPGILASIEELLSDEFRVLTATDAQEALRLLQQEEVAVILSDQRMPGLSGDQFLSRAKEVSGAARVLISGYTDLDTVTRAVNESQIYAYVIKPWDATELRTIVQRAAGRSGPGKAPRAAQEAPPQAAPGQVEGADRATETHGNTQKVFSQASPRPSPGGLQAEALEKMIKRVPVFRDFSHSQVRQLLQAGRLIRRQKGQMLCRAGEESAAMFLLLSGELVVKHGQAEVSRVSPMEVVGEMGAITGAPRSADVEVAEDATLVAIRRDSLDLLVHRDGEVMAKVYKNMLDSLCERLRENNTRLMKLLAQGRDGMNAETLEKMTQKIPFLQGLSAHQVRHLLQAGQVTRFKKGQLLCRAGDKSTAMFILVSGELSVKSGDVELSRIRPVDVVGEMGVITGMPRSATIEVAEDATLIAILKMVFDLLIKKDIDLAGKVYKNVFESLCRKLEENRDQLAKGFSGDNGAAAAPEPEPSYPQGLKEALQEASGKVGVDGRTKVKELIQLQRTLNHAPATASQGGRGRAENRASGASCCKTPAGPARAEKRR